MIVLDASAVIAFLEHEGGRAEVETALEAGAAAGAANWSEVVQKMRDLSKDWEMARAILATYDFVVEPVTVADAEAAAHAWQRGSGLSLGDRLCLALGERLDAEVLTADRAWGTAGRVRQIR